VRLLGMEVGPQRLQPVVQLRWMLRADMGMPSEPFRVWARAKGAHGLQEPLPVKETQLGFFFDFTVVTWPSGSMANVSIDVASSSAGTIFAFAGGPLFENVNGSAAVAAGNTTVEIGAPVIDGLLVPPSSDVTAVRGIATASLSRAAGWVLLETVGLPVSKAEWHGIGRHGDPQGLTGALVDAPTAAIQRLKRGGPPVGWGPTIAPGVPAPNWSAPVFPALVAEVNTELLHFLRGVIPATPPNQLAAKRINMPVAPPQNSAGQTVNAHSSDSKVSPFGITLIAAGSDPFLSLVLGFGTAYPFTATPFAVAAEPRLDYMITAHWEEGLNGASGPVDYAAIVPAPALALPPPAPANLATEVAGLLKPVSRDREWRCTSRVSWDKLPSSQLFRTVSFAAARSPTVPPQATAGMMDKRTAGGFRPIALNSTDPAKDPAWWRNHAIDREFPIPTDPGTQLIKFGIAVQDIYGQWTRWMSVDETLQQPALDRVRIVTAKLTAVAGPSAICPATLEVEFLWDWSVRSPEKIQFVARLYAAAEHGSGPPSVSVPSGLSRSIGGLEPIFSVNFSGGSTPSAPGATFIGLDATGEKDVGFGAAQGNEGRRYRMVLPGFSLNFGLTGHVGLALWARAQERIPPHRTGAWSLDSVVVTASDPRPPVVPIEHVQLGSLPDAAGQSHARIAWSAQPGASGYFIYESDETQILKALNLHEPTPNQTLDDRLKIIKDNFAAIPRRVFTRLNATPIPVSSSDINMPKGSTAIHCYIVLGISAGQVESDWPTDKNRLIAAAAPHIMIPAPPMLEVESFLDTSAAPPAFKSRVTIKTRAGPRVKKIELHRVRVDDAAKEVDTMGPPVASVQTSADGWVVTNAVDPQAATFIDTVQGIDSPGGSWRRVWYRATAWTEKDDTRGGLPGRSAPSTAAWIVAPPSAAPVISAISAGGGPAPADVILEWTSAAPLKRTPLGPHLITARASVPGVPALAAVLSVDAPLDKLPRSLPASPASGVWIVGSASGPTTYRAIVRRAAVTDHIRFAVRITDPIGRTGEALIDIPAGPVDPAPDLTDVALHKVAIPPAGRLILEFASTVPLLAPPDGPYRVRVTSFPAPPAFPPIPATVEVPVGNVPNTPVSPFVSGLFRLPGSGPKIHYAYRTGARVAKFVIRIIAPDGRFVEKTQVVV